MAIISSALHNEDELERNTKQRQQAMIEQSKAQQPEKNAGYFPLRGR